MFKISSLVVHLLYIQYRFWLFLLKDVRMASSEMLAFFFSPLNCEAHAVLHMHCHCPAMHKLENILGFHVGSRTEPILTFVSANTEYYDFFFFFSSLGFNPRITGMKSCQGKEIAGTSRHKTRLAGSRGGEMMKKL